MSVIRIETSTLRPTDPRAADAAERNRVMQAHAKAMKDMRRFRILSFVKFR